MICENANIGSANAFGQRFKPLETEISQLGQVQLDQLPAKTGFIPPDHTHFWVSFRKKVAARGF
jgi:hypothetical protein